MKKSDFNKLERAFPGHVTVTKNAPRGIKKLARMARNG